jgi:hypothetical protein
MNSTQQIQSGPEFTLRMRISGRSRDLDAFPVQCAGFLDSAKLLEGLATMKISRRIVRIVGQKSGELLYRGLEVACFDVLHGEPVPAKPIRRILFDHGLQDFKTIDWHSHLLI